MAKSAKNVSIIGGADGPTSVVLVGKNSKQTVKQRIQKFIYIRKRKYIEKTLKPEAHTMDEVIAYIQSEFGFVEMDKNSDEVKEGYEQMRAAFIMQYAPELLGNYRDVPQLKSESQEDLKVYFEQIQERMQRALEIPTTEFDIDFHKFKRNFGNTTEDMHIVIEKRFAYIGGGAIGNKKVQKRFQHIYKDVYRYYGVTQEDIRLKSERYKDVVRGLM